MDGSMKRLVLTPQPSTLERNADGPFDAVGFHTPPAHPAWHAIHLDSCVPFERIVVRTRRSDYEVVVLPGNDGEVLVRGGLMFGEFRRATLTGSTFGGSAIRVGMIEVGGQLELRVDGQPIVTSTIQAVSRMKPEPEQVGAM
jgi:hypothetical protein